MLHPTRAVTLSRDFKAEAEQINIIFKTEIIFFASKHSRGTLRGSIQTN